MIAQEILGEIESIASTPASVSVSRCEHPHAPGGGWQVVIQTLRGHAAVVHGRGVGATITQALHAALADARRELNAQTDDEHAPVALPPDGPSV